MLSVSVVILGLALFFAILANSTLKPRFSSTLTSVCLVIAVAGGILFYGVGLAEKTGDLILSVIRTPICVVRMFLGVNELATIADTSLVRTEVGIVVFWLVHMLAFFSMASAVLNTIGANALRHLRYLLSRRGELTLIYGINGNSIHVGKECLSTGKGAVVFLTENASSEVISDLNFSGMTVLSGQAASEADEKTLRTLRIAGRKLTIYALDEKEDKNLFFALKLKDSLEKMGIPAENTRITLPGTPEIIASMLQVSETSYGFGYVNVYEAGELSARAMIRMCPPWETVKFGEDGRAKEDFECIVIGFGRVGQAALLQLVMNGQFTGADFRADVFSPKVENESGYLRTDAPSLFENYDIRLHAEDGRSYAFFQHVEERLPFLKLIAVCTGDEVQDRKISDALMLFLKRRRSEHICVLQVGHDSVRYQETVGSPIRSIPVFSLPLLSAEEADRGAIILNSVYDSSDRSNWEKWIACDTFGKMSSRASADFLPAFLRAAGVTREQVASGEWNPDEELLQVLGEMEHKRWNAFHFAMGYSTMTPEEFDRRATEYARCQAEGIPCSIRVSRDRTARIHACLIPWEELDALSDKESVLIGKAVNYKRMDINNVMALSRVLCSDGKEDGEEL